MHQHLWPAALLASLGERAAPPRLLRQGAATLLELPDGSRHPVHLDEHDPDARLLSLSEADTAAVIAHSSPLGFEDLPSRVGQPLLDAAHAGLAEVGATSSALRWWGALPREIAFGDATTAQVAIERLLSAGAAGLQVPAPWLATPDLLAALAQPLAVLQEAELPLLVHPGASDTAPGRLPRWWDPVVAYTAQMQAAWWAWTHSGREHLSSLRICFAAGAGLAPVHAERHRMRGGDRLTVDPLTFVDLSGYGPQAFDALLRVLGIDTLIAASDHPYATALALPDDPAAHHAITRSNPRRLLHGA